jgi:hypothetical protein
MKWWLESTDHSARDGCLCPAPQQDVLKRASTQLKDGARKQSYITGFLFALQGTRKGVMLCVNKTMDGGLWICGRYHHLGGPKEQAWRALTIDFISFSNYILLLYTICLYWDWFLTPGPVFVP